MTVLRIFESITLEKEFEEGSVTNPYEGKPLEEILPNFTRFLKLWLKRHRKSIVTGHLRSTQLVVDELSFRFKSGPMGPSILTAHLDALALFKSAEFLKVFSSYCEATGNEATKRLMELAGDCCIIVKQLD